MGYVETKSVPRYGSSQVGWWPDPILNFLGPIEIASGDLQSFWIRVNAPEDQPAGLYSGSLTISGEGIVPVSLKLRVRVRAFTLPKQSPLPLAITFAPDESPLETTKQEQAEWRKSESYPLNAWRKHKTEWVDFLADYYISYDSLYHRDQPDFEMLSRLHEQGRLGLFNLGNNDKPGSEPDAEKKWPDGHLPGSARRTPRRRNGDFWTTPISMGATKWTRPFSPPFRKPLESSDRSSPMRF
jgi:hypothetical protein